MELTQNIRNTMEDLTDHLSQLSKIRTDECFRLTYLFNGSAEEFIEAYSGRCSKMFQFLSALEMAAIQLDKMKFGSSISTVAGSSVGIVGGVLSITGLVLVPFSAGLSLGLTATGLGLGVTSGVNSLVTGITEAVINNKQGNKANDIFKDFMADVQKVLDSIEKAASRKREVPHLVAVNVPCVILKSIKIGKDVYKKSIEIKRVHTAAKILKSEKVVNAAVSMGLQSATKSRNIPRLAAELPEIGQLAKGTPLALSKTARVVSGIAESLLIGMDIFFLCKESISLYRGSKSEVSELIHSRFTLWRSEIEAWGEMHDCLLKGKATYQENLNILEQAFTN